MFSPILKLLMALKLQLYLTHKKYSIVFYSTINLQVGWALEMNGHFTAIKKS